MSLSNPNRTKDNMNTRKVKRHRNSDIKTGNRESQQNYRLGMVSNELPYFTYLGLFLNKPILHIRTTKALKTLRIHAVGSAFVFRCLNSVLFLFSFEISNPKLVC